MLFLFIIFFSFASSATAAPATRPTAVPEPRDFAAFVDGFLYGQLALDKAPGFVFVAVSNGQLLHARGYGYADPGKKIAMDPARTVLRIGDVTQLFTATAAISLTSGRWLNLDEDVNVYFSSWKLANSFQTPVTMRRLLTHTSGLGERWLGSAAPTSKDQRNFAQKLERLMPPLQDAPGTIYSRSRFGYTLAAAIMERVSRQKFPALVQKQILDPLEMRSTAFDPPEGTALAIGHKRGDSGWESVPIRHYYNYPALGLFSTGSDMSRFLISQLPARTGARKTVLGAAAVREMQRVQFTYAQQIGGAAIAWQEWNFGALKGLALRGSVDGFSCLAFLAPEKDFGFFIAANADTLDFEEYLAQALAKRYWPEAFHAKQASASSPNGGMVAPQLAGGYRKSDEPRGGVEKALAMLREPLRLREDEIEKSITLLFPATQDRPPPKLKPAGKDLFRDDASGTTLAAVRGESGKLLAIAIDHCDGTWKPLAESETPSSVKGYGIFAFASALVCGVAVLISYRMNREAAAWGQPRKKTESLWFLSLLFWILQIAFLASFLLLLRNHGDDLVEGFEFWMKALFMLPLVGTALLLLYLCNLVVLWFQSEYRLVTKLLLTAMACASLAMLRFLYMWNLLGFHF